MYTHTHTHLRSHNTLLFHYPGALLASAPLQQGRLTAGELAQTVRMEEKGTEAGGGSFGGMGIVRGRTWWETAALGWRGLVRVFFFPGGFSSSGLAMLKARAVLKAWDCQGERKGWGKLKCFDMPPFHSAHQSQNREASRSDRLWPLQPLSTHDDDR